ncbi:MAG: M14 family zinc carboxypeptidase [Phycisphaerales bacterium]
MPRISISSRIPTSLIIAALGLAAGITSTTTLAQNAQPLERLDLLSAPAPTAYENHMVVSVYIRTEAQLQTALDLAVSSWTERPGIGRVTLQIMNTDFDTLAALGVAPMVQIPDLQAHNAQRWSDLVERERLDRENQAGAFKPFDQFNRGGSSHDESWFTSYKQLADIYTYMDAQVAANPDLITKSVFGTTVENRDMFSFTITAPDEPGNLAQDRPVIIWNGGQHAREWVSPMTVTYIASKLLDDASSDPEVESLLNSVRFVIIPVLNPDGYLYSWSSERYWRKNRRDNPGTSFDGVDLNRNWGIEFGGAGTSTDPSSDIYHGPNAFSEPETTALSNLALSYGDDLAAHIDFHTFSQLILWPLGYAENLVTPEPDRSLFQNLSQDMSALIQSISGEFYNPIQSWQLYAAAGTCSDWFYAGAGVPSFTVELRPADGGLDGFSPPDSIILPTAQENWESSKLFAKRTTAPISLSHDPVQIVDAGAINPVMLTIADGISTVDPASVILRARIGNSGAFASIPMTDLGSSSFTGDLPPAPCDEIIEYYFSAVSQSGASVSFPVNGESAPLSVLAQEVELAFDDAMETDTGWVVGQPSDTATTGIWERAVPESTPAQPENDHTPGAGTICWITDASAGSSIGANDIDGGATTLTSPSLDASSAGTGAELVYWRWYSNNAGAGPDSDSMLVQISDDNGASWSALETVTENANQWVERRYDLAGLVELNDQIKIRFIASDLGDGSIVEAGVDDVQIVSIGCSSNPADINSDGSLNFLDVSEFLSLFGSQDPQADFNNDGQWNFLDVSAFLSAFAAG